MNRQRLASFRPGLERLEAKRLLSASPCDPSRRAHRGRRESPDPPLRRQAGGAPGRGRARQGEIDASHPVPRVPHHEYQQPADRQPETTLPAGPGPIATAGARPDLQRPPDRREERDGPDIHGEQRVQGQADEPIESRCGPDPHGRRAVEAESMGRLLCPVQAILSRVAGIRRASSSTWAARRRRSCRARRGSSCGSSTTRPPSPGRSTGSSPMVPVPRGGGPESRPARHGHQRDRRREYPPHRFRRPFLIGGPARCRAARPVHSLRFRGS